MLVFNWLIEKNMINAILTKDVSCPECKGSWMNYGIECESCQKGIIPERTLKFISEKMIELEDFYICRYKQITIDNIEINFKLVKENLKLFGLNYCSPFNIDLSRNTVKIIDQMIEEFHEGEYLIDTMVSELAF